MNISIPNPGDPIRELLGDISEIALMLSPENRDSLPDLTEAQNNANSYFASDPASKSIYSIVKTDSGFSFFEFTRSNTATSIWQFC